MSASLATDENQASRPHRHGDSADELTGSALDIVTADGTNHAYIVVLTGG
jgi:hypothetical protein